MLVIDDNEDLRELMQVVLSSAGFDVDASPSGLHGVAAHRVRPYDLVVTDLFMPTQDGFETIQLLRRVASGLKVVAISGGGKTGSSPGYLFTAMEIGADAVLAKPFVPEALVEVVQRLLV